MHMWMARTPVTFEQQTDYPSNGRVIIKVDPLQPRTFKVNLRIPQWSAQTQISINSIAVAEKITPGTYFSITREWKSGDHITLNLDLSPHIWPGEKECAGKASLYRGPILFAMNVADKGTLPTLQINDPKLVPYATAGANGVRYATWLPMKDAPQTMFSKSRPLPTVRVAQQR